MDFESALNDFVRGARQSDRWDLYFTLRGGLSKMKKRMEIKRTRI